MDYEFNPLQWTRIFAVPASVAENNLKIASGEQLKVLLYISYNNDHQCKIEEISQKLGIAEETVEEALIFWENIGVLSNSKNISMQFTEKKESKTDHEPKKKVKTTEKHELSPVQIADRIEKSKEIKFLFERAENIYSRMLNHTEQRSIVWIHDYMGLSSDVIIMLLQHCREMDKLSAGYIEAVAKAWCEKGINDAKSAEEEINRMSRMEVFFRKIKRIFGIESRKLNTRERGYAEKWCDEGFSDELIEYAFDKNIDYKKELSFAYIDKILFNWKEKGYTSKENVDAGESNAKSEATQKKSKKTYDFDALTQIALDLGGNDE
ncbi:MAG: DnaD domain protein [Oscillospiraceae bacterium]|nr:DnaD domain protein [Oscillospiraceae bacterium]